MRTVSLTTARGGINRLRIKGGPSPEVLYDCINGYVNQDGEVVSRPGSEQEIVLPSGTKGLCAFNGKLYVFSATAGLSTGNAKYVIEVLRDPVSPASAITAIHFAKPYLGAIYVVAEFASGNTYHYWLQAGATWAAKTGYGVGDVVQPTTPNGFAYRAHRLGNPNPVWAPGVPRQDATPGPVSIVEPTTPNGFLYVCTATTGASPRSGTIEPEWPASNGATVVEDVDVGTATVATPPTGTTTPPPTGTLPDSYRDRYQPPGSRIQQ